MWITSTFNFEPWLDDAIDDISFQRGIQNHYKAQALFIVTMDKRSFPFIHRSYLVFFLRLLRIAYIVTIGFLLIEHRIHSNLFSHLYALFMRDNRCWFDSFPLIFLRFSRRSQIRQDCISFLVLNDEWRIYFCESRDVVVTIWFAFKRNASVVYFSDGIRGETCNDKIVSLFLTGISNYLCVNAINVYDARGWWNFFRDFLGSKSL